MSGIRSMLDGMHQADLERAAEALKDFGNIQGRAVALEIMAQRIWWQRAAWVAAGMLGLAAASMIFSG